jgi:NADP-dependent 3-hydroxy acid dehydrogenase YdfG
MCAFFFGIETPAASDDAQVRNHTQVSTGAAGFVGRSLVRALSEASYRVRAGVHRANGSEVFAGRSGVEPMTVDILDQQSLSRATTHW